jgi:hypothetical protein
MNENDKPPKTEFKILEIKPSGITSQAWFYGETKIGTTEELEVYLNRLGDDGWDVAHTIGPTRLLLRRKVR